MCLISQREVVLDTETTGLSAADGHRVVEIGCVELANGIPTGQTFHVYLNPDRDMPAEAFAVHGLSAEFLADKPKFGEVAESFLEFIAGAPLVAHNAGFDHGFLCHELKLANRPEIPSGQMVDTLTLARRKHPGGGNKLDDLCKRYGIDNSKRTKHGALLDAEILSEVYVELTGKRQTQMMLVAGGDAGYIEGAATRQRPAPLSPRLTRKDVVAHREFVAGLGNSAIWLEYATPQ